MTAEEVRQTVIGMRDAGTMERCAELGTQLQIHDAALRTRIAELEGEVRDLRDANALNAETLAERAREVERLTNDLRIASARGLDLVAMRDGWEAQHGNDQDEIERLQQEAERLTKERDNWKNRAELRGVECNAAIARSTAADAREAGYRNEASVSLARAIYSEKKREEVEAREVGLRFALEQIREQKTRFDECELRVDELDAVIAIDDIAEAALSAPASPAPGSDCERMRRGLKYISKRGPGSVDSECTDCDSQCVDQARAAINLLAGREWNEGEEK